MSSQPTRRKVTQKTIAQEANVSQTLVSLVLNGSAVEVAESTRAQILEVARKLGYSTKKKTSGNRRQRVLAYIRPFVERGHHEEHWIYDSYEHYYNAIQQNLLNASLAHGYSLIVKDGGGASALQHWLEEWDVDGVFWHHQDPKLIEWIAARYATVQINRHAVINADAVSINQEESILMPLEYLRKLGHTRIIVNAFANANEDSLRRYRRIAYEEYIAAHRMPHWSELIAPEYHATFNSTEKKASFDEIEHAIIDALERPEKERPTALLAGDHYTLVTMKRLLEKGYSLPRDLSIVGIDNIDASAFVHPALTSLDNELAGLGKKCVDLMMQRISSPNLPFIKSFITPRLVIRNSAIAVEEMRCLQAASAKQLPAAS